MADFMILSLPRSRSAWMAEWLGFDGRFAIGHDLAVECSSVQDFEDSLDAHEGTVETGAMIGWRLLRERHPGLRLAVVLRPIGEVIGSLTRLGFGAPNTDDMVARAEMLRALASQPGVRTLAWTDLDNEGVAAGLWEFCLQRDFDFEWWMEMRQKNVQIDMGARLRRIAANAPGLDSLKAEIVYETRLLETSGWLN